MSDKTKIEWTDYSWSPWEGCTKISPGCHHCYAERFDRRMLHEKVIHWGRGAPRRLTKDWKKPTAWNQWLKCAYCGDQFKADPVILRDMKCWGCGTPLRSARVFPSVCDWLDDEVPIEWLARFLKLIHETPNLDWQLLTKRPELWRNRIERVAVELCIHFNGFDDIPKMEALRVVLANWLNGHAPKNVWIGTSVENQEYADRRIPELLKIPAVVRFLSLEPLLSIVDLSTWLTTNKPHEQIRTGVSCFHSDRRFQDRSRREHYEAAEVDRGKQDGNTAILEGHPSKGCSGKQIGRLSDDSILRQRSKAQGIRPQGGLDDSKPAGHSGWHADKSQEREAGRLSAGEPGTSNAFGEHNSQLPGARQEGEETVRGTQLVGEGDFRNGGEDSIAGREDGAASDRGDVRNNPVSSVGNTASSELVSHRITWIIIGGESGPGARQFSVEWARSTVQQCKAAGVACFVKQLGAYVVDQNDAGFEGESASEWPMDTHTTDLDPSIYQGAPVRVRLRDSKGGDMSEWPQELRVREFPNIKS